MELAIYRGLFRPDQDAHTLLILILPSKAVLRTPSDNFAKNHDLDKELHRSNNRLSHPNATESKSTVR